MAFEYEILANLHANEAQKRLSHNVAFEFHFVLNEAQERI